MKKILLSLAAATLALSAWADTTASYPGGEEAMNQYITENLTYPELPKEMGIEGVVTLNVTIKADGTVGTIKVVRLLDPDLEAEAIRLVKGMPTWTPAEVGGAPAEETVTIAVPFYLQH